jgi:hypothetical protein
MKFEIKKVPSAEMCRVFLRSWKESKEAGSRGLFKAFCELFVRFERGFF